MAYTIMIYAIILFALIVVVSSAINIRRSKNDFTWIRLLYMLVGVFWAVMYIAILSDNCCTPASVTSSPIIIQFGRPGMVFAFGVMAIDALFRVLVELKT